MYPLFFYKILLKGEMFFLKTLPIEMKLTDQMIDRNDTITPRTLRFLAMEFWTLCSIKGIKSVSQKSTIRCDVTYDR